MFSVVKVRLIGYVTLAVVSLALVAIVAVKLPRRRKRQKPWVEVTPQKSDSDETLQGPVSPGRSLTRVRSGSSRNSDPRSPSSIHSPKTSRHTVISSTSISPGVIGSSSSSHSAGSCHLTSSSSSANSERTLTQVDDAPPAVLCKLGLDSIAKAVRFWEKALHRSETDLCNIDDVVDSGDKSVSVIMDPAFQNKMAHLIELAHSIHEEYDVIMSSSMTDAAISSQYPDWFSVRDDNISISSSDSFVSASELVDMTVEDLELVLYEEGLQAIQDDKVRCRVLRTKMVGCVSDSDFLAKVFAVRQAFDCLFRSVTVRKWFADVGKTMISAMLFKSGKDPADFQLAYESMIEYCEHPEHWDVVSDELAGRGVVNMSFFDVVIDFVFLDSFEDLDSPPSSVMTIIRNRWLSDSFKETALNTAVWSVLKAKRRRLKYSNGFISHFYAISEHVSPLLAWGFLGPPGKLKRLCAYFKDQVLGFVSDIFNSEKTRYTNATHLADDIMLLARQRNELISQRLGLSGGGGSGHKRRGSYASVSSF